MKEQEEFQAESESTRRARKNLLAINTIICFVIIAGVKYPEEISILGTKIQVVNIEYIFFFLIAIFFFYSYRYWVLFMERWQEFKFELEMAIKYKLRKVLMKEKFSAWREGIMDPSDKWSERKLISMYSLKKLKHSSWFSFVYHMDTETHGVENDFSMTLLEYCDIYINGFLRFLFLRKEFVEIFFPILYSLVVVLILTGELLAKLMGG